MKKLRAFVNGADIRRFRFWVQLLSFAVLVYGGYVFINLGQSLPTFSCAFNQVGKGGVCYLLPLQHQMDIPWRSIISWRGFGVLTGFLTFLAWLFVFNKAWCGYVCPLGTIQDWMTKLRQRLGIRYATYSLETFSRLKPIKYVLLVLLILIPFLMANSVAGLPKLPEDMATPFCKICPARMIIPAFTGDFSQWTVDFSSKTSTVMTALGLTVLGIFIVGAFVNKRFFCFFCPMSALHSLFADVAFLKLKKDGDKCTRCGDCYRACDMQIKEIADDVESKTIVKQDCMLCLKCVAACPEDDCLKATFLGIPIYESSETGFFKRTRRGK
jgi:ferredoxin-type protein NapH